MSYLISIVLVTPTENNWKVHKDHWIFIWPCQKAMLYNEVALAHSNKSNVHQNMQLSYLLQNIYM